MKTSRLLLFIVCVLSFSHHSCVKEEERPDVPNFDLHEADEISDEEYQVYAAVIEQEYPSSQVVIEQKSSKPRQITENLQQLDSDNENLTSSVIADYLLSNEETYFFADTFLSPSVILLPPQEQAFLFESLDVEDNWDWFYEIYPNSIGIITLSRVGFNSVQTQAIVQVLVTSGSSGSNGKLYYLEKYSGEWEVLDIVSMIHPIS